MNTPTAEYLKSTINDMDAVEASKALDLVASTREGQKALIEFTKSLTPKKRKAMTKLIHFLISPLDRFNRFLEQTVNLAYKLPL